MLLADQGAQVFKIDPAEGDPLVGTHEYAVWNRGKTQVASSFSIESILGLVHDADLLIECLNPNQADDIGLSMELLAETNSKLILVSLPAFPKGHKYENLPAREELLASSSGIYALSPSGEVPVPGEGPSFHTLHYASTFAAITAASAIAAALIHRNKTNQGQKITVPIHDSMYQGIGTALVRHSKRDHGRQEAHPVIERFYECSDNRWVNVNLAIPRFLEIFLNAIEHPEWMEYLTKMQDFKSDPSLVATWKQRISKVWKQRTALEWESLMSDVGLPVTMCRSVEEWVNEQHAIQSGAVLEIDDPHFGKMKQPGVLVRTLSNPGIVSDPAPYPQNITYE
jgi:crotonobetainyl-CoA:carnitine CoA-transferase CaiB-like acyl-CoA transferase